MESKGLIRKVQGNAFEKNELGLATPPKYLRDRRTCHKMLAANHYRIVQSKTRHLGYKKTLGGIKIAPTPRIKKVPRGRVRKSTPYKQYSLNNSINNSLSSNSKHASEIEEYFLGPVPENKKRSEREHFKSLTKTYSTEQIALAFAKVRTSGDLKGGAPVHSPMAYLSFQQAFPGPEEQQKYIVQFARLYPMFSATGPGLRSIAINHWASQNKNPNQSAA